MKYVALLRGINVGGKNMIKMADLKIVFEKNDYTNVITYINSGNVIFESDENDNAKITTILEHAISQAFHYDARLVIRSYDQLQEVIANVPREWEKGSDLRCYIAFLKDSITTTDVQKEIEIKEGIDFVKEGKQVLYLSTKLDGLTKSGFTKLASKKIYQYITIRNYTTTTKLLTLMEQ